MATKKVLKKTTEKAEKPALSTMTKSGKTVNVSKAAQSDNFVIVLFKSRQGQRFDLSNGQSFTLIGSGAHLADAHGGILPPATYTVNKIDRELWERAVHEFGDNIIRPWMEHDIIAIEKNETKGIDTAFETEFERAIDDPVEFKHAEA